MPFPNHREKYSSKPLFSPEDLHDYRNASNIGYGFRVPEHIILCYAPTLMDYVAENHSVSAHKVSLGDLYILNETSGSVGLTGNFGFGAPVAVTISEVLIALGVKRIINIGVAGALQRHVDIGDIIICNKAIRDEGTSHHYVKPKKYAYPHSELTKRIMETLDIRGIEFFTGPSWTTDAPYRETIEEVLKYQKEGILTVDMEASALFALGNHRNVEVAALFTVSDSLADLKWRPEFRSKKTLKGLETIFDIALNALSIR
jgi:purine-nucleoside phosphorylase